MTRPYEIVYIFDSTLEESQVDERLDQLHEFLKSPETPEPITATKHWGRRTLAYAIEGKDTGHYVIVRCEAKPDALTELERLIKLETSILRHLIVLNEGLAPLTVGAEDDESVQPGDDAKKEGGA